jgi:hypothetical protein
MPMLGDVLAAAKKSAASFHAWLEASDPELMAQLAAGAATAGVSTDEFVRIAVADFARFAAEEDWAALTSGIRTNSDPGTVCLLTMVRWYLDASAAPLRGAGRLHHLHEE